MITSISLQGIPRPFTRGLQPHSALGRCTDSSMLFIATDIHLIKPLYLPLLFPFLESLAVRT